VKPNLAIILAIGCLLREVPAHAQALTAEVAVTVGASTDNNEVAAATQVRIFGDARAGIRYFAEASWARTTEGDSDAFGAAYPYGNQLQVVESYGERIFTPQGSLLAVRAGRYRTPFGISSGSDHAYTGFLRAPLIRYGGYFALSNNFLEHGVDVLVGSPRLSLEGSLGRPADIGAAVRRPGMDGVVRVQAYAGPFIIGVSHIRTSPYQPALFSSGRTEFTGVDARFMREGIQVRGEIITGHPFDGVSTTGWYADAIVHHVGMGPVTAVARVEQLDYDTPVSVFVLHTRRQTFGARVRLLDTLSAQVNLLHQTGQLDATYGPRALDVAMTYTFRRP